MTPVQIARERSWSTSVSNCRIVFILQVAARLCTPAHGCLVLAFLKKCRRTPHRFCARFVWSCTQSFVHYFGGGGRCAAERSTGLRPLKTSLTTLSLSAVQSVTKGLIKISEATDIDTQSSFHVSEKPLQVPFRHACTSLSLRLVASPRNFLDTEWLIWKASSENLGAPASKDYAP